MHTIFTPSIATMAAASKIPIKLPLTIKHSSSSRPADVVLLFMGALISISISALIMVSVMIIPASASDPDPLQDFCVADLSSAVPVNGFPCRPNAWVAASDFASPLLRTSSELVEPLGVAVNLVSVRRFPGLNTQGLSIARIDFEPGGLNPPHVHPRASEVFYVSKGTLKVAFVSTGPEYALYERTLREGEVFVFPRGLVHYQTNEDSTKRARAIAAFNSQSPGRDDAAVALFGTTPRIPAKVLQRALGGIPEELVNVLLAKVPPPA